MEYFSGLEFSMAGFFKAHRVVNRHTPTYYGVQYNHSGGLFLRIDGRDMGEVEGAWAFVSHPGAFFEYGSLGGRPREHHFVCFHGPRVERLVAGGLLPVAAAAPLVRINHPDKFQASMMELISMINGARVHSARAVLALEGLLLQLREQDSGRGELPAYQEAFFAELLEEIREKPRRDWDFNREAAKINVTPTHFRRLFKRYCGCPPRQHLINLRLRLAATMLLNDSERVGKIAAAVGIGSEFYFSRLFKRRFRLSPMDYRREFVGRPAAAPEGGP